MGAWKEYDGNSQPCEECSTVLGEGSTTLGEVTGSASQCICSLDFYLATEPLQCAPCPDGGVCDGGPVEFIRARPGF